MQPLANDSPERERERGKKEEGKKRVIYNLYDYDTIVLIIVALTFTERDTNHFNYILLSHSG